MMRRDEKAKAYQYLQHVIDELEAAEYQNGELWAEPDVLIEMLEIVSDIIHDAEYRGENE